MELCEKGNLLEVLREPSNAFGLSEEEYLRFFSHLGVYGAKLSVLHVSALRKLSNKQFIYGTQSCSWQFYVHVLIILSLKWIKSTELQYGDIAVYPARSMIRNVFTWDIWESCEKIIKDIKWKRFSQVTKYFNIEYDLVTCV